MADVVCEDCQVVVQNGASDQEVQVADKGTFGSQARSFVAEESAYFVVQGQDFDKIKKTKQDCFVFASVAGVGDTFVEFGDGDDADADPFM